MLKESEVKVSRGWQYKELELDISESKQVEQDISKDIPMDGIQISMFD